METWTVGENQTIFRAIPLPKPFISLPGGWASVSKVKHERLVRKTITREDLHFPAGWASVGPE